VNLVSFWSVKSKIFPLVLKRTNKEGDFYAESVFDKIDFVFIVTLTKISIDT